MQSCIIINPFWKNIIEHCCHENQILNMGVTGSSVKGLPVIFCQDFCKMAVRAGCRNLWNVLVFYRMIIIRVHRSIMKKSNS